MSGYQEVATDPSFAEQIVCFTAPMVGNYGVDPARSEAARPHARAVVMREARGPQWTDWLAASGVVALTGVDTRSLALHLRERGAMRAAAVAGHMSVGDARSLALGLPPMNGRALVAGVSTTSPVVCSTEGRVRVAVVDYGCKQSILRRLAVAGAAVTLLPHDADANELLRYDGVLLSNGPGDPAPLDHEVATIQEILGRVPVLGICLGHQLLGRAVGLDTFKLRFGHRGSNHPVLDRATGRVFVTTQNHGFGVVGGDGPEVSHVSLYDGTVEGLTLPEMRARSVQFHPEACPGPHDAWPLIQTWVEELADAA
jgi:carbamoyl-phosphate synthase small subunit